MVSEECLLEDTTTSDYFFYALVRQIVYYVRLRIRTEVRCIRKIGTEIE